MQSVPEKALVPNSALGPTAGRVTRTPIGIVNSLEIRFPFPLRTGPHCPLLELV